MNDKTVVAYYDEFDDAARAVEALRRDGIPERDISLLARDPGGDARPIEVQKGNLPDARQDAGARGRAAGVGAGAGAAVGGLVGLVGSLGLVAIPGVGPLIALGPLAATLAGAGVGAVTGGLIGALVGRGVPEKDAEVYAEGVRRGGAIVAVTVAATALDRVERILDRYDPVDIDERAASWRSAGWRGFDRDAPPLDHEALARERAARRARGRVATPIGPDVSDTARDMPAVQVRPEADATGPGGAKVRTYVVRTAVVEVQDEDLARATDAARDLTEKR